MKYLPYLATVILAANLIGCGSPANDPPRPVGPASAPTVAPAQRRLTASARASGDDTPSTDRTPITKPGEMPPLDRSVLDAPKDKLVTPEAKERNHWIMDQLWTTNLGQEYLAYLTDPIPAELVPGRALQLVERVYAKGRHLSKRQKAIEAFTLDLYARGKLTEDIMRRDNIFIKIAKQKESDGMDVNSSAVIKLAIVGAVAAFAVGSPAARDELMKLRGIAYNRCRFRACEPLTSVDWRRMLHPRSFKENWDLQAAWNTFGLIAGGGSMLYSFGFEKWAGFQKDVDLDREMLNGREKLLIELEF